MSNIFRISILAIIYAILTLPISSARAQDQALPKLKFPLECVLGETCWQLYFVDVDPATNSAQDSNCLSRTYDGHKGTDFSIRSMAELRKGVNVLAATDGTVLRLRDGQTDTLKSQKDLEKIEKTNKSCGNGLIMDARDGWEIQYCHLKKDSIAVKIGDTVKAGDIIAQVGQSGAAEFPHLHLTIYKNKEVIDPFTGLTNQDGCGKMQTSLWEAPMPYEPFHIYDGGFADHNVDFEKIKAGEHIPKILPRESDIFMFWAGFIGTRKGDEIQLQVFGPQRERIFERTIIQPKNQVLSYYSVGRKLNGHQIPPGIYTGTASLKRENLNKAEKRFTIDVR